jgi:sigma-E factor negative regulatory protein RseA
MTFSFDEMGSPMAGSIMDSVKNKREQVSALADSELDLVQTERLLPQMRDDEARATWDLYHRIGDAIRSDAMAAPVSADFSSRCAARFASEPALLAPQRRLLSRVGAWPATLAAIAATGFGFFIAPTWFKAADTPPAAESAMALSTTATPPTLLADAKTSPAAAQSQAAYIRLHHASYSPLYGTLPGGQNLAADSATGQ